MTERSQGMKAKMEKWDQIKLLCSKENSKMKRQAVEWEEIFMSYTSHKGLISKIHKEFLQLNSKNNIKKQEQMI